MCLALTSLASRMTEDRAVDPRSTGCCSHLHPHDIDRCRCTCSKVFITDNTGGSKVGRVVTGQCALLVLRRGPAPIPDGPNLVGSGMRNIRRVGTAGGQRGARAARESSTSRVPDLDAAAQDRGVHLRLAGQMPKTGKGRRTPCQFLSRDDSLGLYPAHDQTRGMVTMSSHV
jgi:hypothetical protein